MITVTIMIKITEDQRSEGVAISGKTSDLTRLQRTTR
jgi:hypothetical protein